MQKCEKFRGLKLIKVLLRQLTNATDIIAKNINMLVKEAKGMDIEFCFLAEIPTCYNTFISTFKTYCKQQIGLKLL